jgi:hypothetical protein
VLLLTSAAAYELGLHATAAFLGKQEAFARDGAASLIADGFHRGAACTEDFSEIDHLSLAHLPLADVRRRFGVPPLTAAS